MSEGVNGVKQRESVEWHQVLRQQSKLSTCNVLYMCLCVLAPLLYAVHKPFLEHRFIQSCMAGSCCAKSVILGIKYL